MAVKHSKTHGEDIIVKQFWLEGHSILATHWYKYNICSNILTDETISGVSPSCQLWLGYTVRTLYTVKIETANSQTYSYIVDGHADRSMVINLLGGNGLGLVSQKDPQQQQKSLVAIHHTWRDRHHLKWVLLKLRGCLSIGHMWKLHAFLWYLRYLSGFWVQQHTKQCKQNNSKMISDFQINCSFEPVIFNDSFKLKQIWKTLSWWWDEWHHLHFHSVWDQQDLYY